MKLRLYLDTSVFSALFDDRAPDRRALTEEFWRRLGEFEVATSDLARFELKQTPDADRRCRLLNLLENLDVVCITDEMQRLADAYLAAAVFTEAARNDAVHVAAAVLSRQDVLVSWNFKHLVNRRRRAMINDVNASRGVRGIEIVAPPEL